MCFQALCCTVFQVLDVKTYAWCLQGSQPDQAPHTQLDALYEAAIVADQVALSTTLSLLLSGRFAVLVLLHLHAAVNLL